MKRAFSKLSSQLLKKSENDELQSTIRFIARGSRPSGSISSLLERGSGQRGLTENGEEDSKHVERILKILNSTLPEVESRKKRVEAHYDVLFSQLKNIVETSIKANDQEGRIGNKLSATNSENHSASSDALYDKLMLMQYTNQLTNVGQMAKIILSKNFTAFDKVWSNISLFHESQLLDLSLLLYFRCGKTEISERFENQWFDRYHELHIIVQRLLWRCVTRDASAAEHFAELIQLNINRIENWKANDMIVLYQSLFAKANLLPEGLTNTAQTPLSENQELFIKTLRVLSRYESIERKLKKWMVKLVKLSIENKVALERLDTGTNLSIYQYRFIRSLDLTVRELHSACEGKKHLSELQQHLETILIRIYDEEQEVKSQMSLKFI